MKEQNVPRVVSRLRITNRKRTSVTLLPTTGTLRSDRGLGQKLIRELLASGYPLGLTYGTGAHRQDEVPAGDRIVVLQVEDKGREPGTLARLQSEGRALILSLQPAPAPDDPLCFAPGKTEELTRYFLEEMTRQ